MSWSSTSVSFLQQSHRCILCIIPEAFMVIDPDLVHLHILQLLHFVIQCCDAVDWLTGRASGLYEVLFNNCQK